MAQCRLICTRHQSASACIRCRLQNDTDRKKSSFVKIFSLSVIKCNIFTLFIIILIICSSVRFHVDFLFTFFYQCRHMYEARRFFKRVLNWNRLVSGHAGHLDRYKAQLCWKFRTICGDWGLGTE